MGRWRAVRVSVLLIGGVVALLGPGVAAGRTITVINTNDNGPGSLCQAIVDAGSGDMVAVPTGTYMLTTGELAIAKSLTISGAGAAKTIISNGAMSRVFHTSGAGNSITITGVAIRLGHVTATGGTAVGGGVLNGAEDAPRGVRNLVDLRSLFWRTVCCGDQVVARTEAVGLSVVDGAEHRG